MGETKNLEMKEENKKTKEQGKLMGKNQRKCRKIFPNCKTQISRLKDSIVVSVTEENRFLKDTSLKNVRTRVTRKILKGSREDKTS